MPRCWLTVAVPRHHGSLLACFVLNQWQHRVVSKDVAKLIVLPRIEAALADLKAAEALAFGSVDLADLLRGNPLGDLTEAVRRVGWCRLEIRRRLEMKD